MPGPSYSRYPPISYSSFHEESVALHTALEFARSIALLSVGRYAGGVLFVVLAPSTGRLPGAAYVRQWQALNRIADSWNPDQLPITWQQVRQRWAGLRLVRTILGVSAFACLIIAQAIDQ